MTPSLADGPGTPIDVTVSTALFVAAALLAIVALARLRWNALPRLPRRGAWAAAGLAGAALILAAVLPPILRPDPARARPSTHARLQILSPTPGEVLTGNPAVVTVRLELIGGRIVATTSTHLIPDAGHLHLLIDDRLVSMTYGLTQQVEVLPGTHVLRADFVAVDHAPFDPPVEASVTFRVVG